MRSSIASFRAERLKSLRPGFVDKILERLGVNTFRKQRVEKITTESKADEQAKKTDETEVQLIQQQLANLNLLTNQLEASLTLCNERSIKIERAKRKYEKTIEQIKIYYAGEGLAKIKDKIRQSYNLKEVERSAKVNLDHSIILVDKSGLKTAIEATEKKPGLRSRIIIYDADFIIEAVTRIHNKQEMPKMKFLRKETKLEGFIQYDGRLDGPNAALCFLTKTDEGFELLKAAQSSQSVSSKQEGIFTLDQYLASIEQKRISTN